MDPLETYDDLVAYFQGLIDKVAALKGVTVGDDEAILDLQNSRIKYPHLWVETPEISFAGTDDNPVTRFDYALVVIANETTKTNKGANATLNSMLEVMKRVYAVILEDADEELFDLVLKPNAGTPVRRWSADNAFGWRLEITIELPRCECDCD